MNKQNLFEIQKITKMYDGKPLLRDISLSLNAGETICMLGASGSGKSTLLRIISGIEKADSGSLFWQGADIQSVPAHQRNFGLMFQNYALFPHLNVWENAAFGLHSRDFTKTEIVGRVERVLNTVNMLSFARRRVTELSGGEQQRVALARTLAIEPRLLLLDEPLAALDRTLSQQLLSELREILHQTGIPAIYVTHDQEEAYAIADRLVLLMDGVIQQEGTPQQIFSAPNNLRVAEFLGLTNTIQGKLTLMVGEPVVQTSLGEFKVERSTYRNYPIGSQVVLVFRDAAPGEGPLNLLDGTVTDSVFSESGFVTRIDTNSTPFTFRLKSAFKSGEKVKLVIPPESILVFPG